VKFPSTRDVATTIATWDVLQEFGFAPDTAVISDDVPGLSYDFGNFKLAASAVMGKAFQPVVLFTGVLATPRTVSEVCFEIPRGLRREVVAAWIVWNLDRVATGGRFTSEREVDWLDLGREHKQLLPWEIARTQSAERDAAYAARPHCTVNRSVLKLALNTLEESFSQADVSESVIVAFDGRVLSFLCHGVETVVGAAGNAWPARYSVPVKVLREELPKRLMKPAVEVGIWKSMLEIDRSRCPGAIEIKNPR
jgi:hypothetical protein